MIPRERDSVEEVRRQRFRGGILLVCAYESDEEFYNNCLDKAIPLSDLRAREYTLPQDQHVVFYSA